MHAALSLAKEFYAPAIHLVTEPARRRDYAASSTLPPIGPSTGYSCVQSFDMGFFQERLIDRLNSPPSSFDVRIRHGVEMAASILGKSSHIAHADWISVFVPLFSQAGGSELETCCIDD